MRNNDSEIKRRIKQLHESGTKNWQTLANQVWKNRQKVEYNLFQQMVMLGKRRVTYAKGGRGIGKTTIQGRRMRDVSFTMPRSLNSFVGTTYEQLLSQTIGSLRKGLAMHGLHEGLHYFIGRKAPDRWQWPKPFQAPSSWKHAIHFFTGAAYRLVSLEKFGSGQGLNTDSLISDETAQQIEKSLQVEVKATMRGSDSTLFKHRLFRSELYTSTPSLTANGIWFDDKEKDAFIPEADTDYFKGASRINEKFLAPGWLADEKATTLPELFEILYNLKDKARISNLFYPLLDEEKHTYVTPNFSYLENLDISKDELKRDCRKDKDIDEKKGLLVGLDFGASINSLVVGQLRKALQGGGTLRFLNAMYVLNPKILDDLIADFIEYYKYHPTKKITLCYDASGNHKQVNKRKTLAQEVTQKLKKAGWSVSVRTKKTRNPEHDLKFKMWNKLFKPQYTWSWTVEFNRFNCATLLHSMKFTPAKYNEKQLIEKDKSSERDKKLSQEKATHLGDAADYLAWYILGPIVLKDFIKGGGVGGLI